MTASSSPSIFPLLATQKWTLVASVVLQIVATAMGLIPLLIYLMAIALFYPPIERTYIWTLVIASLMTVNLPLWINIHLQFNQKGFGKIKQEQNV